MEKKSKTPDLHEAYLSHKEVLLGYLSQKLINSADVEEILQETYLKALEAGNKRIIHSPKSYLFIIARNLAYKRLRQSFKRMMREIDGIGRKIFSTI